MKNSILLKLLLGLLLCSPLALTTGCQGDDDLGDDLEDAAEETQDAVNDAADEAGDEIDDAT